MRTKSITNVLDNIRMSMLEDLTVYTGTTQVFIYYKEKTDGLHFADYEVAETQEPTIGYDPDDEEIEIVKEFNKAKEQGLLIPGYANVLYPGELYEITSLKKAIRIVAELEYPEYSKDVITVYTNLWMRNITPYKLSSLLEVSKQSLSQWLNGIRPFPEDRKKQIADILKFDIKEYTQEPTKYKFDYTDL